MHTPFGDPWWSGVFPTILGGRGSSQQFCRHVVEEFSTEEPGIWGKVSPRPQIASVATCAVGRTLKGANKGLVLGEDLASGT